MNHFINTSNPSSNPAYDVVVPLDLKSVLNPLEPELSAQCTLQNTHYFACLVFPDHKACGL